MQLREITQSLIEKVEKETGYRVHVVEDASLNTFAAVKMARGSALFHTVLYNPKTVIEPDYVICFMLHSLYKQNQSTFSSLYRLYSRC